MFRERSVSQFRCCRGDRLGLQLIYGIPHDCRPGSSRNNRRPIPIPAVHIKYMKSAKKHNVFLNGPRWSLQVVYPTFPSGWWWSCRDDLLHEFIWRPAQIGVNKPRVISILSHCVFAYIQRATLSLASVPNLKIANRLLLV